MNLQSSPLERQLYLIQGSWWVHEENRIEGLVDHQDWPAFGWRDNAQKIWAAWTRLSQLNYVSNAWSVDPRRALSLRFMANNVIYHDLSLSLLLYARISKHKTDQTTSVSNISHRHGPTIDFVYWCLLNFFWLICGVLLFLMLVVVSSQGYQQAASFLPSMCPLGGTSQ